MPLPQEPPEEGTALWSQQENTAATAKSVEPAPFRCTRA